MAEEGPGNARGVRVEGAASSRRGALGGNALGILLMLAAMASFVTGDAMMKLASSALPTGETIFFRGIAASLFVWTAVVLTGGGRSIPLAFSRPVALRSLADVGGSFLFQSALARMPFAEAGAILQVNPLVVTAAAAIFLGEKVGWRRWTATAVGFAGALLIIRPGSSNFSWWSIVLILSVMCSAVRDLATRKVDPGVPALVIAGVSVSSVMLASLLLAPFETWAMPTFAQATGLMAAGALMLAGQICVVISIRASDISAVVPFRYSAIVWSLLIGSVVWGDFPDQLALFGIAIVAAAGLYTFFREQKLRRMAAAP